MNRQKNVWYWMKQMVLTEFYFGKIICSSKKKIAIYDFTTLNIYVIIWYRGTSGDSQPQLSHFISASNKVKKDSTKTSQRNKTQPLLTPLLTWALQVNLSTCSVVLFVRVEQRNASGCFCMCYRDVNRVLTADIRTLEEFPPSFYQWKTSKWKSNMDVASSI